MAYSCSAKPLPFKEVAHDLMAINAFGFGNSIGKSLECASFARNLQMRQYCDVLKYIVHGMVDPLAAISNRLFG
jgi:hypothetical protein